MRAKDAARLSAIRLILAGIKQREVDERKELDDKEIVGVVEKMIKQRRESISQYEKASRADLVEAEKFELEVLQAYLPQQLSDAEIEPLVPERCAPEGIGRVSGEERVLVPAATGGRCPRGDRPPTPVRRAGTTARSP